MARVTIAVSKFVTSRINRLELVGAERLHQARVAGRGLLTISNHVSLFDDPLLTSNLVSGPYRAIRWIGADALNFFGSPFKAWLFTAGKSVPIVRGAGIDQPAMHFLRDRLRDGEWVHMFPEGGRTRDPEARMTEAFRPGTGWLIDQTQPIVLPFYHYGMHKVLPVGAKVPRRGNDIRLRFGEAVDCGQNWIDDTVSRHAGKEATAIQRWAAVASELRGRLAILERHLHPAFAGGVGH